MTSRDMGPSRMARLPIQFEDAAWLPAKRNNREEERFSMISGDATATARVLVCSITNDWRVCTHDPGARRLALRTAGDSTCCAVQHPSCRQRVPYPSVPLDIVAGPLSNVDTRDYSNNKITIFYLFITSSTSRRLVFTRPTVPAIYTPAAFLS